MKQQIKPLSLADFPPIKTNCVGFALGYTKPVSHLSTKFNLDQHLGKIEIAFLNKLEELGYELPRKIEGLEEAKDGEYVLIVYGFRKIPIYIMGVSWDEYDFHVARREPNGQWVHKPGWDESPREMCPEDWSELEEEYGSNYALFAFAA